MFSSANVLQKYTMEQLVALGVTWVWLGLEGKGSQYTKLAGTDADNSHDARTIHLKLAVKSS